MRLSNIPRLRVSVAERVVVSKAFFCLKCYQYRQSTGSWPVCCHLPCNLIGAEKCPK